MPRRQGSVFRGLCHSRHAGALHRLRAGNHLHRGGGSLCCRREQREVSDLRRSLQLENFYGIRSSYAALRSALTTLLGQLAQADLDEQNAQTVSRCTASISDAQNAIAASGYNDTVRSFLRRYDHLPTNLLARLAGVDYPESFA